VQVFLPPKYRLNAKAEPEEHFLELNNGNRIHLDVYSPSEPKATIILFHGVGGNGRLLSFLAVPLLNNGYQVICPDMPLYGYSKYKGIVNYDMWVADATSSRGLSIQVFSLVECFRFSPNHYTRVSFDLSIFITGRTELNYYECGSRNYYYVSSKQCF